jgi:hypothetical protein
MSRVNLEHNLIYSPRIFGARHGQVQMNLTGSYVILSEGPSMFFLRPNGAERDVFLPPITPEGGQLYFIANTGVMFDLNIFYNNGTPLVEIAAGTMGIFVSSSSGTWSPVTQQTLTPPNVTPVQRSTTASPIVVAQNDEIINCSIAAGAPTCTLAPSASRNGKLVVFKDTGGNFQLHPLTVTPASGESIDGLPSIVLSTNFACLRLRPYNDGVNSGWSIEQ